MKLITYQSPRGPRVAGVRNRQQCVDLNEADPAVPACVKALLAQGPAGLERANRALQRGQPLPTDQLQLLPVVPNPEKILCIGLNYRDHAKETGVAVPDSPVVFCKASTAARGHGQPIELPAVSTEVDYEAELVVVIGRGGRNIHRAEAMAHVAGYCCGNDVSARDWQKLRSAGQWFLGKSFDTFAPVGPAITTADEVAHPGQLHIELRLNGQVMQNSNTSNLIFPIDELIGYVSQVMTLSPGDLLFTGTPPGVGMARKPPVFLKPGDVVEVEIENLGVLSNPVV